VEVSLIISKCPINVNCKQRLKVILRKAQLVFDLLFELQFKEINEVQQVRTAV
jgi:hypothetical protein